MGKPKPPPPPDPVATANAQAAANLQTAQEQQRLNMINTQGPNGSVRYEADPTAPGGYRQTTTLDPAQQAILDAQNRTELGAVNIASDQLGRVRGALETPLSTSGLPELQGGVQRGPIQFDPGLATSFDTGQGVQYGFDPGHALQYGFDPGQQVQGHVGPVDLNAAARQAQDAVYGQAASRLDPRFSTEQNQLETRLANQGLSQNSDAYKSAMDEFARGKNDAYNQAQFSAIGAGNDVANQRFGQSLAQGQFANSAAAQQYAQNQGLAGFNNQTAAQDFGQNQAAAAFHNQAAGQDFGQNQAAAEFGNQSRLANMQAANAAQAQDVQQQIAGGTFANQARNQGLQERAYLQNQPINQLTGLLSLGQVSTPQGIQYTPSQVANTDVLGAYALNQQAQQAAYNARAQQGAGLMNGLFSLGSAAIMASDGRLKTDKRLLRVRPDGVEVWAFRYLTDPEGMVRIGVMAQQVRRVRPELVVRRADGFLAVDYASLEAA